MSVGKDLCLMMGLNPNAVSRLVIDATPDVTFVTVTSMVGYKTGEQSPAEITQQFRLEPVNTEV
jgi:hypothetical protein